MPPSPNVDGIVYVLDEIFLGGKKPIEKRLFDAHAQSKFARATVESHFREITDRLLKNGLFPGLVREAAAFRLELFSLGLRLCGRFGRVRSPHCIGTCF